MNPRSLRYRLVLWYAAWLAAVFVVAGVLLDIGLRHYAEKNLGNNQVRRAERIAALLRRAPLASGRDLAAAITENFAPEASGRFVRVSRGDGSVLYQSGAPGDRSFDAAAIAPPPRAVGRRRERQDDGTDVVIAAVAVTPDLLVETGESLAPALSEMRRLLVSLAIGFAVLGAVALGGSVVLLRRALRPVEEITGSAERISSRNLGERLPVPPSGDEFEHLSKALNRMIERLDHAFQHNRRFLADASHELRTPLTVLRGELEAMVRREDLAPDVRDTVGNLLDEVARLARLVENLFALSRLDAGEGHAEHARFDFAKLVATTSEQMCLLAEDKGLRLTCEAPAPVTVEGDPARIKQVVVNLLDNAIKYTPAGGAITLRWWTDEQGGHFSVTDTGPGISEEHLPRLTERFYRVDAGRARDAGGSGLGLAIVRHVLQRHGATLKVESVEGRGSTFSCHFPPLRLVHEPVAMPDDTRYSA